MLSRYMEVQKEHISAAYTGTISTTHAAKIMATTGIKGTGTIWHHSMQNLKDSIAATVFFDIGTTTSTTQLRHNDSTVTMQTNTRLYLVSQHRSAGTPLSMADTRIMAPITAECATLVHLQQGTYRVVQGGTITCTSHLGVTSTVELQAGETMHIDRRSTCNSTCIEIGHRPFVSIRKSMPDQPTVHHSKMLAGIIAPKDRSDTPHLHMGRGGGQHDTEHNLLGAHIREAQEMIDELHSTISIPDARANLGLVGLICALLVALLLLFILVRWRCTARRPSPGRTEVTPLDDLEGNNNSSYE